MTNNTITIQKDGSVVIGVIIDGQKFVPIVSEKERACEYREGDIVDVNFSDVHIKNAYVIHSEMTKNWREQVIIYHWDKILNITDNCDFSISVWPAYYLTLVKRQRNE